jgi:hypothetical protein
LSQDTRDTPSDAYRQLNSPRKPGMGYERADKKKRGPAARVASIVSTLAAIIALLGIAYWALSRPTASLPERIGRYARLTDQGALEDKLTTANQALTKGNVKVALYGTKGDKVIFTLFAGDDSPNLDAFAARATGGNAAAFQESKSYREVRKGGARVRCVDGGVTAPYLTQCIWQEGDNFAVVTTTEATVPAAERIALQAHDAAITSWTERMMP